MQYYVYFMTNNKNDVIYVGITNNLVRRAFQHRNKKLGGFTCRYNVDKLVYFEVFDTPEDAITREKQIKGGSRQKKIDLITKSNPTYRDLYKEIAT